MSESVFIMSFDGDNVSASPSRVKSVMNENPICSVLADSMVN